MSHNIVEAPEGGIFAGGDRAGADLRNRGIWKRFLSMLGKADTPKLLLLWYILLNLGSGVLIVKLPAVSGNFFAGDADVRSVTMFLALELIITAVSQYTLYINHILRYRMNRNLRNTLWGKILHLKPRYFDRVSPTSLLSRITVDADSMNEFLLDIVLEGFMQVYYLVLTIMEMSRLSIRTGLLLLGFLPFTMLISFVAGRLNMRLQNGVKLRMADLTDYLSELLASMPLLSAFNRRGAELKRGKKVIDAYYKAEMKTVGFDVGRSLVGSLTSLVPETVIILLGIRMMNAAELDGAAWYTFYLYAGSFLGFCTTMAGMWESAKGIQGRLNRVADVLDEEDESTAVYAEEIVRSGDVLFDNVTFRYEEGVPVLDRVCFTVPRGKVTALIGRSGSGKTTLLKLFDRLYEPTEGRILTGGREIAAMPLKEWRKNIAFVSQATPLFSGTLRENLLYGIDREVPEEELMDALRSAGAEKFVKSLPEGPDHPVGQFGSTLSGGQRQKLSIARAILSGAEFLVLDEPTASLDMEATKEVLDTIKGLSGSRTVLLVTHDPAAVRIAQHVVTLEEDHGSREGEPREMANISRAYRELLREGGGEA